MKHKIIIHDKISNKVIERESNLPDKEYLKSLSKNKSCIYEDRRKKKPKYKKDYSEEN